MVSSKVIYTITAGGSLMMGVAVILESIQIALLSMPSSFATIIYGSITLVVGVILLVAGGYQLLGESGIIAKKTV